jgi:hypothetical protein
MANAKGKNTTSQRKKPSGKKLPNIGSAYIFKRLSTNPDSVACKIAHEAFALMRSQPGSLSHEDVASREVSDAAARLKAEMEADEAAFAAQTQQLFAAMCVKLGRVAARKIFMDVMGGAKQQSEERIEEDLALQVHRFASGSTRRTAERAIALGLRGSEQTVEQRVRRCWRKVIAANPHLARGGSDK